MRNFVLTACVSIPLVAFSLESDQFLTNRIYSHLAIKDFPTACQEAELAVKGYPYSKMIRQAQINAFAKSGEERKMLLAWQEMIERFPEESDNRELIEAMAWCIIDKGFASNLPITRAIAMLGAFVSQDGKGVAILLKSMRDSSTFIRALSLELASQMKDDPLQREAYQLFQNETNWNVRLAAVEAMGSMGIAEARPMLMQRISNEKIHPEEKAAAIVSLVELSEEWEREDIQRLVNSNRAGFRALACKLVAHFEQSDDLDLLMPLLKDNRAEVRVEALQTLGLFRIKEIQGKSVANEAERLVGDNDPLVAATAAWLLTITDPARGQKAFEKLLESHDREARWLIASALCSTGKYGLPLMIKVFNTCSDPYLGMNLAIGLIAQRENVTQACDCLYQGLMRKNERWMWKEQGMFQALVPSKVKYDELIPNSPEAKNQLVRLEVLNMLAIVNYPKAQQAAKSFLQHQTWGISGVASTLLLTEGDETAKDIVEALLQDSNQNVKVQAALILALWGRGEKAISVLQDAYEGADRDMKEKILEGVAKVALPSSIPFLLKRLHEPYQTLRIIAAAALLECLYH